MFILAKEERERERQRFDPVRREGRERESGGKGKT